MNEFDIDKQFGHSAATGKIYGTSDIDLYLATGSKGLAQSKLWHQFFHLDLKTSGYMKTLTHYPSPRLESKNATEQFQKTILPQRHSEHLNYDCSRSFQLINNLKQIHGPDATWKSNEQALAAYYISLGSKDVICVLPTGGGKTETLLCSVLLSGEFQKKTTVLLVPTISLKCNMYQR